MSRKKADLEAVIRYICRNLSWYLVTVLKRLVGALMALIGGLLIVGLGVFILGLVTVSQNSGIVEAFAVIYFAFFAAAPIWLNSLAGSLRSDGDQLKRKNRAPVTARGFF